MGSGQPTSANVAKKVDAPSVGAYLKNNVREYGMLITLVVIMVFFQFVTGGVLFKAVNLTNLVLQNSFIVIMALGMLLVIVAGHIDLSVGSIVGFIGAVAAVMTVQWHMNFLLVMVICLVIGGLIGAAQGYWVAYHRIPAFIVTLAGMLVFRGLTLFVLGGSNVGPFPKEFQLISTGFIPDFADFGSLHSTSIVLSVLIPLVLFWFSYRTRKLNEQHGMENAPFAVFIGQNVLIAAVIIFLGYQLSSNKGLPNVLIIMSVLIALYTFITNRTTIGRRIYALGGNEKAAKLSGIDTQRLSFLTFVNMGVLAALAGLIVAARLNSSTPKAGVGFELDVIAACFIGGASAYGGVGKITGAVIGALIMGVMNNGMSIVGLGIDFQQMIKGLVLLAAVFFDVYNKNKA
jgi:putative multiple sugar transport system permease protein